MKSLNEMKAEVVEFERSKGWSPNDNQFGTSLALLHSEISVPLESVTVCATPKNQASFSCVSCSFTANADVNAARNILAAGLAVAGRGGTPHRDKELSSKSSGPMKRQLLVGTTI